MKEQLKREQIRDELKRLCKIESQKKVAARAKVSNATISQMVNNNWDLIRPELWKKVCINLGFDLWWNVAITDNYETLITFLGQAQLAGMSMMVAENAGAGKSQAYKDYKNNHKNVILVECKKLWNMKRYIQELCVAAGIEATGRAIDMFERFTDHVKGLESPLIILDQYDKLNNDQRDTFIDMYNDLGGRCGIFLSGVPALKKLMERGCQNDRIGFKEIRSRSGHRYLTLPGISLEDVEKVCNVNGISDEQFIENTYNDCDDDYRRVRYSIEIYYRLKELD